MTPSNMRSQRFKVQGLTLHKGQGKVFDLPLEFEGDRAFVIWDTARSGNLVLETRVEIDPGLLQKLENCGCDFFYCGHLMLPRPEAN